METPQDSAPPEAGAPKDDERKKKTVWLLAVGGVSLLIPLVGALYLHWSQNSGPAGPTGRSDVFERREGDDRKIAPTQTAVVTEPSMMMPPPGSISGASRPPNSSMDFIRSGSDVQEQIAATKAAAAAPAAAASTAPAEPATGATQAEEKPAAPKKPQRKPFVAPKLHPSNFKGFGGPSGGAGPGAGGGAGSGTMGFQKSLKRNTPGPPDNQIQQIPAGL